MNNDVRNLLRGFVNHLAAREDRGEGPYTPGASELGVCLLAFEQGYVNVCPPGDRYRVNAAGLQWLSAEPAFIGVPPPYLPPVQP